MYKYLIPCITLAMFFGLVTTTNAQSFTSGELCPIQERLTQNLRTGAYNGTYHPYTRGIVKEAHILQSHLNRLGFSSGKEDGKLGPVSDGAIKRMQRYLGLAKIDGIVGPNTRAALNSSCGTAAIGSGTASKASLLAQLQAQLADLLEQLRLLKEQEASTSNSRSGGGGGGGSSSGGGGGGGSSTTNLAINNTSVTNLKKTSAQIDWNTNLSTSNHSINYGTTTAMNSSKTLSSGSTTHSTTLSGLTPDTRYYYQIISNTSNGKTANTSRTSFTTLKNTSTGDGSLPSTDTACSFEASTITANQSIDIDCIFDLNNQTITLPANVDFEFQGGDITNGTLIFNGGEIDGELLNHTLEIEGEVDLESSTYIFNQERWNIVEGKISTPVALTNRMNMNKAIQLTHRLGASVFELDEIDAYFEVGSYHINSKASAELAISIPKNTHFKMSDKTWLRVQPSNAPAYYLVVVFGADNVKISGGHLYGDRFEHDYSPVNDIYGKNRNSHEWGHTVKISGGDGIIIDGVEMADGTGDSLTIGNTKIRNKDGTPGDSIITTNLIVRNSIITRGRRNGIGLVDGEGILFENNQIINSSLGTPIPGQYSSAGTWPKWGIDLESFRERVGDELHEYEKVDNITLRGNTFSNNYFGDINIFTATNILIENNIFNGGIANRASSDVVIRNNTFDVWNERTDTAKKINAVHLTSNLKKPDGSSHNFNYEVYGNTINGFDNGIAVGGGGHGFKIHDNIVNNAKISISFGSLIDSYFSNNVSTSTITNSIGYYSLGGMLDNVYFSNESTSVTRHPLRFTSVKGSPIATGRHVRFNGGTFNGNNVTSIDGESSNIEFIGSSFNRNPVFSGTTTNIVIR